MLPDQWLSFAARVQMPCLDELTLFELIDGSLRRDALTAVDDHLDACALCRRVVIELARGSSGERRITILTTGTVLGRYIIIDVLGRGAFGVVYRAYDPELDRRVALKLLRADRDRVVDERLLREAKAMARLSHPNVVAVYEVGRADDCPFIVMELVEGMTLRQWLRVERAEGRAGDWRAVVRLFVQVGRGLAAAHQAGLVHRDFKPDNVVVGEDGRPRVTDFGLARGGRQDDSTEDALHDADGQPIELARDELTETLTLTGSVLGTPAYMAPEQLHGQLADAQSDQYSFCVALYEALCAERPVSASSLQDLKAQVAVDGPLSWPSPSVLPRPLMRAIERGLVRERARRHPSMTALLAALQQPLAPRRRRWLGALAVAASITIAAVSVGMVGSGSTPCGAGPELAEQVWNGPRRAALEAAFAASGAPYAQPATRAAQSGFDSWASQWSAAYTQICEATQLRGEQSEQLLDLRMRCLRRQRQEVDALLSRLLHADERAVASAADALAGVSSMDDCADVESLTAVAPPNAQQATQLPAIDQARAALRAELATGHFSEAVALAEALVARAAQLGYGPALAEAQLVYAQAMALNAQSQQAEEMSLQALWTAERARDERLAAQAWLVLANAAGMRGDYSQAERACGHAEVLMSRFTPSPRMRADLASSWGLVHYNLGRYREADKALNEALSIRRDKLGEQHVDVARSYTNLGNLARARGDYAAALSYHQRARKLDDAVFGPDHPNEARHLHNIARILFLQGDRNAALDHYQRALALKVRVVGAEHPDVALTHNSLGLVYADAGDDERARYHYEQALRVMGSRRHIDAALAHYNLGLLEAHRAQPELALRHFDQALPLYEQLLGNGHRRLAELWFAIGDAQRARSDVSRALDAYYRARGIVRTDPAAADLLAQLDDAIAELPSGKGLPPIAPARPASSAPASALHSAVPRAVPSAVASAPPMPSLPASAAIAPPSPAPQAKTVTAPTPPPSLAAPSPKAAPSVRRPPRGAYGSGQAWD